MPAFKLEEIGKNFVKFDGLLYEKIDVNHLRITINGTSNGKPWKEVLELSRSKESIK